MLSRPLSFVVAGAAGAATLTAASAPSPLYPVYQRLWSLTPFTLTVVFAVYVVALLASLLTVGSLSDRLGRRPVASAALVVLALGMVLFTLAGGPGGLVVARVVQGLAVGAATGTTTAMIMDSAPDPRTGSVVSSAVPALGIAVGAVLAGALVQFAPLPRQLVFWVLATVYLVLAALVWLVPEPARPASASEGPVWRSLLPSAGLPAPTRPVFLALVPAMGATWALSGLYLSLGSSIVGTVLGVRSHFLVGCVLGVFFVGGMLGTVGSAALPPRLREPAGNAALVVGVLLTIVATVAGSAALYVVGSAVAGLGFGAAFRFVVGALGEAAPPDRRGQVFATMYVVSYVAFSVPALVAGLAAGRFGLGPTAVAYGAVDVALVVVAVVLGRVRTRRAAAAPSGAVRPAVRTFRSPRHRTSYLEAGPADGPLMIFLHGWPATGSIWRTQLATFAAEGWRCVAPDLRGFGASSVPRTTDACTVEEAVHDLAELHDHLGGRPAVWVGHDWGSAVAGALAAHEPQRCRGVVLTSWAYYPASNALATLVPLVDRSIYPAERYPDGQWDYYRYYTTHLDRAVADLDADPAATLASVYRRGDPDAVGAVSPMATVTRDGGRFGGAGRAPATTPDPSLWPPDDFAALVSAFTATGFRASCAWYTNDDANLAYARRAPRGGRLAQPVLFLDGELDVLCSIAGNRQGDPMRAACDDLTVASVRAGHWLPLERGEELVHVVRTWLDDHGLGLGR